MKNQSYLVSTMRCWLICRNVLFSFGEITRQAIKLQFGKNRYCGGRQDSAGVSLHGDIRIVEVDRVVRRVSLLVDIRIVEVDRIVRGVSLLGDIRIVETDRVVRGVSLLGDIRIVEVDRVVRRAGSNYVIVIDYSKIV